MNSRMKAMFSGLKGAVDAAFDLAAAFAAHDYDAEIVIMSPEENPYVELAPVVVRVSGK